MLCTTNKKRIPLSTAEKKTTILLSCFDFTLRKLLFSKIFLTNIIATFMLSLTEYSRKTALLLGNFEIIHDRFVFHCLQFSLQDFGSVLISEHVFCYLDILKRGMLLTDILKRVKTADISNIYQSLEKTRWIMRSQILKNNLLIFITRKTDVLCTLEIYKIYSILSISTACLRIELKCSVESTFIFLHWEWFISVCCL